MQIPLAASLSNNDWLIKYYKKQLKIQKMIRELDKGERSHRYMPMF